MRQLFNLILLCDFIFLIKVKTSSKIRWIVYPNKFEARKVRECMEIEKDFEVFRSVRERFFMIDLNTFSFFAIMLMISVKSMEIFRILA